MLKSKSRSFARKARTLFVVLASSLLLTGCLAHLAANDPNDECDHPPKPAKPYTDQATALYITAQGEAIDKCRSLLGNKPRMR